MEDTAVTHAPACICPSGNPVKQKFIDMDQYKAAAAAAAAGYEYSSASAR